jgi:hypothetical protein
MLRLRCAIVKVGRILGGTRLGAYRRGEGKEGIEDRYSSLEVAVRHDA